MDPRTLDVSLSNADAKKYVDSFDKYIQFCYPGGHRFDDYKNLLDVRLDQSYKVLIGDLKGYNTEQELKVGIEAAVSVKFPLHTLRINLFQRPTPAENESCLNVIKDIWDEAERVNVTNVTQTALVCHIFSNILGSRRIDEKIKYDVNYFLCKEPNPTDIIVTTSENDEEAETEGEQSFYGEPTLK